MTNYHTKLLMNLFLKRAVDLTMWMQSIDGVSQPLSYVIVLLKPLDWLVYRTS